jgi:hypothetical protein
MAWTINANRTRGAARWLIVLAAVWNFSLEAQAAQSAGMVKTLSGAASVQRDGETLPAAPGLRLHPGDRVAAASGSYVGITLQDDTRIAIGPGSEIVIREFAFDPGTHAGNLAISFLRGTARVITGLIARHTPERAQFQTPTMTIGIRGTDFIVDLEQQP